MVFVTSVLFTGKSLAYTNSFTDDFTDNDNTLLTAHNSIYQCISGISGYGTPVILNNQLYYNNGGNQFCSINLIANSFDFQIDMNQEADIYFENQDLLNDNRNTYGLLLDTNHTIIQKWVNGQETDLYNNSNAANNVNNTYHLEISDNQGGIIVKLNGVEIASVTDATWHSGYIMFVGSGMQTFDNLALNYTLPMPSPHLTPTLTGTTSTFTDDFTDNDNTLLTAHNSIYQCISGYGTPIILNDQLYYNNGGNQFCSVNTPTGNFDYQIDSNQGMQANIYFENQDLLNDNRNTYQLLIGTNYTLILKWVNGQPTYIYDHENQANNIIGTYHLELSDNQGSIIVKLNGVEIASVTDTTWHSGYIMFVGAGTQVFDNLALTYTSPNTPPTINTILNATVNEGDTYPYTGSFTDSDSTSWTGTVDYGEPGVGAQSIPTADIDPVNHTFHLSHTYLDEGANGSYTVTVVLTDNQGASSSPATATITVNNAPFSVSAITAPTAPTLITNQVSASATFSYTNPVSDTHTATWYWGDGSTSSGTVTEPNGSTSGSVSGSHTYSSAGVYAVNVIVTDDDILNESPATPFQYLTIYDPAAGRLDASQKYSSPASADLVNGQSGNVSFGVHVRYLNGSPTGTVQFRFKQGNTNIEFDNNAATILWLTISGSKATVQGTTTLKGKTGTYTFFISAIDNNQNLIRFRITDPSNNVIYDTQPGAADSADPTTAIANGGKVQIL